MRIDVFHDTVCPWCRIGKRNLQLALEDWAVDEVEVHYHAFFLDPTVPPEGRDFRTHMMNKGGGMVTEMEQFFAGPRAAGQRVGLTFNFEQITKAPNTVLSHQLIALVPPEQKVAMIDAVYAAYFENGQDIGQLDVLLDIAQAQGLDRDATRTALLNGEGRAEVLEEARQAQLLGVTGVPLFVFNNMYALSGAQPPQVIRQVMEQAQEMTG